MVDLIEEGIDAVVRVGSASDSRLIMYRLATARFVVCASPVYLKQHGEPQTPEDLKHHTCANFVYPQTRRVFEWVFQRHGQEFSRTVEGKLHFAHAEALLDAAIAGAGVVQVLSYVAGKAIARGELKPVLESYAASGEPISVIYPQKRLLERQGSRLR